MTVLETSARRPWSTLMVVAGLLILSVVGICRMHPDPSMSSLLPRHDPAADALGHVLGDFSAVDDLQVLVSIRDGEKPDPAGMIEFAKTLQSGLAGCKIDADVQYKPGDDVVGFFTSSIAPAGIDYLSDGRYQAARQRLTRAEMDKQLSQDEAMLANPGPAAGGLSKVLIQDPLRLHEFLLDELNDRKPPDFGGGGGSGANGLFSPDGRSLLIRIVGTRPLDDLDYAQNLTATVTQLCARTNFKYRIDISGGYAIAAQSAHDIKDDMIVSVVSSVVLLQVLFVIAYRRPFRYFLLAFVPVAVGLTLGFGLRSAVSPVMSPVVAVIGAVLAGMGIDYTVLYLPHYQAARAEGLSAPAAVVRTTSRLISPLVAACATSVIGFLAVGASSVPALTDFAIVGSLGLAGALLSAVFVLPALLVVTDRRDQPQGHTKAHEEEKKPVVHTIADPAKHASWRFWFSFVCLRVTSWFNSPAGPSNPRFRLEPLVDWSIRHRRGLIGLWISLGLIAIAIIALAPGPLLALESDLTVMHPRPNPPLDAEDYIARRMGFDPGSMQIYLHADKDTDLVAAAYDVSAALKSPGVNNAGVVGIYGLSTWLPDPRVAVRRSHEFSTAQIDATIADFRAAVAASSFDSEAFKGYELFLRQTLAGPPAPAVADLAKHPRLAETMLSRGTIAGRDDHQAITIVLFDRPLQTLEQRQTAVTAVQSAVGGIPGVTVTGLGVVGLDTQRAIQSDLPKLMAAAIILNIVYLLVHLCSWRGASLAMIPALVSLLAVAAFLRVSQQKLNLVNLISLPLLIGIAVDYGIYVVSLARPGISISPAEARQRVTTSGHSILISATANVLGFGSLVTVSVPAIRSLGYAVGIGVAACFLATMLLLVPVLIREEK